MEASGNNGRFDGQVSNRFFDSIQLGCGMLKSKAKAKAKANAKVKANLWWTISRLSIVSRHFGLMDGLIKFLSDVPRLWSCVFLLTLLEHCFVSSFHRLFSPTDKLTNWFRETVSVIIANWIGWFSNSNRFRLFQIRVQVCRSQEEGEGREIDCWPKGSVNQLEWFVVRRLSMA